MSTLPPPRSLVATHPEVGSPLAAPAESRRARLLEGITVAVAQQGYDLATVADVVRLAGVSRSTFYDLFAGKEECFLEAYDRGAQVVEMQIDAAVRITRPPSWRAELRLALRTYLRTLSRDPLFARAYLVEIYSAGQLALASREDVLRRFAERYRRAHLRARQEDPETPSVPRSALFALAAGIDQLVAAELRAGRHGRLPELERVLEPLAASVLAPRRGTDTDRTEADGPDVL